MSSKFNRECKIMNQNTRKQNFNFYPRNTKQEVKFRLEHTDLVHFVHEDIYEKSSFWRKLSFNFLAFEINSNNNKVAQNSLCVFKILRSGIARPPLKSLRQHAFSAYAAQILNFPGFPQFRIQLCSVRLLDSGGRKRLLLS